MYRSISSACLYLYISYIHILPCHMFVLYKLIREVCWARHALVCVCNPSLFMPHVISYLVLCIHLLARSIRVAAQEEFMKCVAFLG